MSNTIEFECPSCQSAIKVGSEAAGRSGECPKCGVVVAVPQVGFAKLELADTTDSISPSSSGEPIRKHRKWIVLLVLAGMVASPFMPKYTIWLGVIILGLCVVAMVPNINRIGKSLLRLNVGSKWRFGVRLSIYCLSGLLLIGSGTNGLELQREKDREIAERAEADAAKVLLEGDANSTVAKIVDEAEVIWEAGNATLAYSKLDEAFQVDHATSFRSAGSLRKKIANAQVQPMIFDAKAALAKGDNELAKQKLNEALGVRYSSARGDVEQILSKIELSTDYEQIRDTLMGVSESDFQRAIDGKGLPEGLNTGYEGLDGQVLQIVIDNNAELTELRASQEQERKEQQAANDAAAKRAEEFRVEKARVEREAKRAEARNERINGGFSAWDGSHKELTKIIKESMNDPGSYKHVKTEYWDNGDHLVVKTTFRGKNAFGGVVLNWVKAKADLGGRVLYVIEQGP